MPSGCVKIGRPPQLEFVVIYTPKSHSHTVGEDVAPVLLPELQLPNSSVPEESPRIQLGHPMLDAKLR